MIDKIHLGIVCPVANEKITIQSFIFDVLSHCKEFKKVTFFTVFDNNCTDGTIDIVKRIEKKQDDVVVLWRPENNCVVDAYICGYKEALKNNCDWILEIDSGYSHQPSDIPKFIDAMESGYDCVFGSRFCEGGQFAVNSKKRHIISKGGTILINLLLGTKLKDMTSGFEMFSRSSLEKIMKKGIRSKGHFFQSEIRTFCHQLNLLEIPISYRNPSNSINNQILIDSFFNLFILFQKKLKKQLYLYE